MSEITQNKDLLLAIQELIEQTKHSVAVTVNSALSMMYWSIGKKINDDILQNKRADYGKEIVSTLSKELQKEYGNGYSYSSLTRMMKFAHLVDEKNIATLSQQLSWSHFRELITLEDNSLKIDFYIQMTLADRWSVRTLREKLQAKLHESLQRARERYHVED